MFIFIYGTQFIKESVFILLTFRVAYANAKAIQRMQTENAQYQRFETDAANQLIVETIEKKKRK